MQGGPYQHCRHSELRRLLRWQVAETSSDVMFTTTADGWELGISHYAPRTESLRSSFPVLLCHGLGSNRLAFDIDPQCSLARGLVEQGFDVYAVDLRGHGLSEKPAQRSGKRWGWGFNTYCEQDIPAAINAVLEATGRKKLHFVGHSMGGILLYSHAALQNARAAEKIRSGITIGSSLDYSHSLSIFHRIVKLAPLTHLIPSVPVNWPVLFSSWAARFHRAFIDPVLVGRNNVELNSYRKLAANSIHPVSAQVLREMAGAIDGTGLKASSGERYVDLLEEKGYTFPVLSISGTADIQCPFEVAARFGTEHRVFGKSHGHVEDYGHNDLIMGKSAEHEVWPEVYAWLRRYDET
tara:strand:- start:23356 stop:24411 length:1056 start_codon:yes stop_codon:yes gene_type:complete